MSHQAQMEDLRAEIRRIQNVTLRGEFKNPDDRTYWLERVKQLSSRLMAFEEEEKANNRNAFRRKR